MTQVEFNDIAEFIKERYCEKFDNKHLIKYYVWENIEIELKKHLGLPIKVRVD